MPQLIPVFLEVALGLGAAPESGPQLVEPSVAGVGHLAIGARPHPNLAAGLSIAALRATYANSVEPPVDVNANSRMPLTRLGIGAAVDGMLPVGPIELWVGGAAHIYHTTVTADGRIMGSGLPIEYASFDDTSIGYEVEVGISGSPYRCSRLGVRGFVSLHQATLDGEEVDLDALGVELFFQADLAGSPASTSGARTGCGVSSGRGP
jgi:hypothetical protein